MTNPGAVGFSRLKTRETVRFRIGEMSRRADEAQPRRGVKERRAQQRMRASGTPPLTQRISHAGEYDDGRKDDEGDSSSVEVISQAERLAASRVAAAAGARVHDTPSDPPDSMPSLSPLGGRPPPSPPLGQPPRSPSPPRPVSIRRVRQRLRLSEVGAEPLAPAGTTTVADMKGMIDRLDGVVHGGTPPATAQAAMALAVVAAALAAALSELRIAPSAPPS
jgi:hypothetical protein